MKGVPTVMVSRVPKIDASFVDLTFELDKERTYEEYCAEIKRRPEGDMKGSQGYCDVALVPAAVETTPISCRPCSWRKDPGHNSQSTGDHACLNDERKWQQHLESKREEAFELLDRCPLQGCDAILSLMELVRAGLG